jgi:hypothetical protein
MVRVLMTEHMEVLLEGRVVISSIAWMVARMERTDQLIQYDSHALLMLHQQD